MNGISNNNSKIRDIINHDLFSNYEIYQQNSHSHFENNQFSYFKYQKNVFTKLNDILIEIENKYKKKKKKKAKKVKMGWDEIKDLMKFCFELHMDRLDASKMNLDKTGVTRSKKQLPKMFNNWNKPLKEGIKTLEKALDNEVMKEHCKSDIEQDLFVERYLKMANNKIAFNYQKYGILCNLPSKHPMKLIFNKMNYVDVQLAITFETYHRKKNWIFPLKFSRLWDWGEYYPHIRHVVHCLYAVWEF